MTDMQNQPNPEAALAQAIQELEEARKKLSELQVKAQTASGGDKPAAYALVDAQQKKVNELAAQVEVLTVKPGSESAKMVSEGSPSVASPAATEFIAEHTLTADETLSHVALKYYGHATPPYWQLIYEANKEVIGDNPSHVRKGMVIKVPRLPQDFKG